MPKSREGGVPPQDKIEVPKKRQGIEMAERIKEMTRDELVDLVESGKVNTQEKISLVTDAYIKRFEEDGYKYVDMSWGDEDMYSDYDGSRLTTETAYFPVLVLQMEDHIFLSIAKGEGETGGGEGGYHNSDSHLMTKPFTDPFPLSDLHVFEGSTKKYKKEALQRGWDDSMCDRADEAIKDWLMEDTSVADLEKMALDKATK